MITKEIRILEYHTGSGENPFRAWLTEQDSSVIAQVHARLFRVERGNLGDTRAVGHGIHEIRIWIGAGVRVYFCRQGAAVIVLLCGGDKGTQRKDILKARRYWQDYLRRK